MNEGANELQTCFMPLLLPRPPCITAPILLDNRTLPRPSLTRTPRRTNTNNRRTILVNCLRHHKHPTTPRRHARSSTHRRLIPLNLLPRTRTIRILPFNPIISHNIATTILRPRCTNTHLMLVRRACNHHPPIPIITINNVTTMLVPHRLCIDRHTTSTPLTPIPHRRESCKIGQTNLLYPRRRRATERVLLGTKMFAPNSSTSPTTTTDPMSKLRLKAPRPSPSPSSTQLLR